MGNKTSKCCCKICKLSEDVFSRPDSDHPGPRWALMSGTGDIVSGHLVVDGKVATRICHPTYYELGSFVSEFDLVNPADEVIYRVSCGDPNAPKATVEIQFFGIPGAGTIEVRISGTGDDNAAEGPSALLWPDAEVMSARVCYAPGAEVTTDIYWDSGTLTPTTASCIDEADADNCFWGTDAIEGAVHVGNFTFLLGEFDNWTYFVHWVDRKLCELCSCFCRTVTEEGDYTYSCVPKVINVTLTSTNECDGISGDYAMYQRYRTDAPEDEPPSYFDFPQKYSWLTDPIACPFSDSFAFVLELRCASNGKDDMGPIPLFEMYCVTYNTADARGSNFGFDPDDVDTFQEATATGGQNVSAANAKDGSGCDPLSLEFPDLRENFFNAPEGNSCCGGYVQSGGSFEPDSRISVVVTL